MDCVIRLDVSTRIGTGHLMRCLALADILRLRGHNTRFVMRDALGLKSETVEEAGFEVIVLPKADVAVSSEADRLSVTQEDDAEQTIAVLGNRPDWLIVDHYAIDESWEQLLRPHVGRIMVIDDLADRSHDCDLLLDQSLSLRFSNRYEALLPESCVRLLGPRFALLRNEFLERRADLRSRNGEIHRVLVFYGGGDSTGETLKALSALDGLRNAAGMSIVADVVVGSANSKLQKIESFCSATTWANCSVDVHDMASRMAEADLAMGAGGTTSWERCLLGLPAIITVIADNQVDVAKSLAHAGAVVNAGRAGDVDSDVLTGHLAHLSNSRDRMKSMSDSCLAIMDCPGESRWTQLLGELETPAEYSIPSFLSLRPMTETDLAIVLEWRNKPRIREVMFSSHIIEEREHREWFERLDCEHDCHYIHLVSGEAVGLVRFTDVDWLRGTADWGFYVGADEVPRGTGARMCFVALHRAFQLGLSRIDAQVLSRNTRSLDVHRRVGFIEVQPGAQRMKDPRNDTTYLSLDYSNWLEVRNSLYGLLFE